MIKINMPMPKSCKECPFGEFNNYTETTFCRVAQATFVFAGQERDKKLCPLKECK